MRWRLSFHRSRPLLTASGGTRAWPRWLHRAAMLPLSEAYPILAWVIENAVRRYSTTQQAATYLRPLYNAMVLSAELAGRVALRASQETQAAKRVAFSARETGNRLFGV